MSSSYQVDLYGLLPVLFIVDAGVVDNDVQMPKRVDCALECVCSAETKSHQWTTSDTGTASRTARAQSFSAHSPITSNQSWKASLPPGYIHYDRVMIGLERGTHTKSLPSWECTVYTRTGVIYSITVCWATPSSTAGTPNTLLMFTLIKIRCVCL